MEEKLEEGGVIQYASKRWKITQISEDNEGQTVYHLKSGDEVSVLKQSDLPADLEALHYQGKSN